jgi:hypothetical protein
MKHEDFRAALEAGDVRLVRKMAAAFMPHLPQPKTHEEAEATMHAARTAAEFVTFKSRAYSHKWLTERNLPSQLPDNLKPSAERLYPRVVEGVGISVNTRSPWLKPAMIEVRQAMEQAVADCYANGDTDPAIVRPRMFEAREKTMKSLFGGMKGYAHDLRRHP